MSQLNLAHLGPGSLAGEGGQRTESQRPALLPASALDLEEGLVDAAQAIDPSSEEAMDLVRAARPRAVSVEVKSIWTQPRAVPVADGGPSGRTPVSAPVNVAPYRTGSDRAISPGPPRAGTRPADAGSRRSRPSGASGWG